MPLYRAKVSLVCPGQTSAVWCMYKRMCFRSYSVLPVCVSMCVDRQWTENLIVRYALMRLAGLVYTP